MKLNCFRQRVAKQQNWITKFLNQTYTCQDGELFGHRPLPGHKINKAKAKAKL